VLGCGVKENLVSELVGGLSEEIGSRHNLGKGNGRRGNSMVLKPNRVARYALCKRRRMRVKRYPPTPVCDLSRGENAKKKGRGVASGPAWREETKTYKCAGGGTLGDTLLDLSLHQKNQTGGGVGEGGSHDTPRREIITG